MKPRCDCLSFCGDDVNLDKGLVRPCPTFEAETAAKALQDAAPDLLDALKDMVEIAESQGHIVKKARAAIRKAEGK